MSFAPFPILRVPAAPVAAGTRRTSASDPARPDLEPLTALQDWESSLAAPGAIEALYSPQYLRQCSGAKCEREDAAPGPQGDLSRSG